MRRVQKKKIRSEQKEGRRFEGEGGAGALRWQKGQDGPGLTVKIYKLEDPEEEDTMLIGVGPLEEAGTEQGRHL